ncbi:MAG: hypothetical protein O6916_06380, partial [bacterium]|nr:hypothetical protein [bacterium]
APDFRVFDEHGLAFFCEVKSLFGSNWFGGARPDPTYNRVSQKIYEAVEQFDAVNPRLTRPNLLVMVNHVGGSGVLDLSIVYTGGVVTDSEKWLPIGLKFSEGRIRVKKRRIHLFIWIDELNGEQNDFRIYNLDSPEHLDRLCDYFGSDPASIRASRG